MVAYLLKIRNMKEHRFRNRVAEGSLTLPVMSAVTFFGWLLSVSLIDVAAWLTLAIVALMTYAFVECNNQCQLLRIRSRMVSASFLAFVSAIPALHASSWHWLPAASLLLSCFVAFKGYGRFQPQGWVFHAFLFLGIGSIVFPPMLLLVPFFLFSCSHQLRILTGKAFVAALLGLLLPYWVYGTFCLLTGFDVSRLFSAWHAALRTSLRLLSSLGSWRSSPSSFSSPSRRWRILSALPITTKSARASISTRSSPSSSPFSSSSCGTPMPSPSRFPFSSRTPSPS